MKKTVYILILIFILFFFVSLCNGDTQWGSYLWKSKIEKGVLKVKGPGGYSPWGHRWEKVASNVVHYKEVPTSLGPIFAYKNKYGNWYIVRLRFNTGRKENFRSVGRNPVKFTKVMKYGAFVKIGRNCYSYHHYAFQKIASKYCN